MTETPHNPNDPAFLFSRSLDEELSEPDRKRLQDALASSEALRAEADELAAVDRLVKRWALSSAELDWENHAKLLSAEAVGEAEGFGEIDSLLARWGDEKAALNWEQFTDAVMTQVTRLRHPRPRRRLIYRLAAPLAAAAAIAIVVTGTFWQVSTVQPIAVVVIGPEVEPGGMGSGPVGTGRAVIRFARASIRSPIEPHATPRISFISVGSEPMQTWFEEYPPL